VDAGPPMSQKSVDSDSEEDTKPAAVVPGAETEEVLGPGAEAIEPGAETAAPEAGAEPAPNEEPAETEEERDRRYRSLSACGFAMGYREEASDEDSNEETESDIMLHAIGVVRRINQSGLAGDNNRRGWTPTDFDLAINRHVQDRGSISNRSLWILKRNYDENGMLKPVEPTQEPKGGGN
jgi:hypothetical protein